jgi:hypothetical protein
MFERLSKPVHEFRARIRSVVLGSTIALAVILLSQFGQGCATTGQ